MIYIYIYMYLCISLSLYIYLYIYIYIYLFNPKQIKICWLRPRLNAFSKRVIWIWVRGWENCRGHQSLTRLCYNLPWSTSPQGMPLPWMKFINFSNWFGSLPLELLTWKSVRKKHYLTNLELISPIINNIL